MPNTKGAWILNEVRDQILCNDWAQYTGSYELWDWGAGNVGTLGQNDVVTRSSPTQLPGTGWKEISGSTTHTFSIKTDGTLWAWG